MKPSLAHHLSIAVLICALGQLSPANASDGAQRNARPASGLRAVVPLDGEWAFQLDQQSVGRAERWFAKDRSFENTIRVPGAWQAQGYGTENDKLRHHHDGEVWYQRRLRPPRLDEGQRLFVCFGGVHRSAEVWVNGIRFGSHTGYLSPFEFDLTPHVSGEELTLTLCVDSRQDFSRDALTGCFDIIDAMFTPWGGLWGHVWLETRNPAWLEDLFVQPKLNPAACTVLARIAGDASSADAVRLEIVSPEKIVAMVEKPFSGVGMPPAKIQLDLNVPEARPWSPETPALYTARLKLLAAEKTLDAAEVSFGFRTIEIRGRNFLLNGRKLFLRGYGDDAIYPETMAAPSDKAFYVARLKEAQGYGFNYVRHHSHMLPPEYYAAADEVGMLISAEFPIAYQEYHDKAKGEALELYKSQWVAAIKRFRNHPSIFNWSMGNELYWSFPLAPEFYRTAKTLDPTRPVTDSDGLPLDAYASGRVDRKTLDFCSVQFDEFALPLDNSRKHKVSSPIEKPCISHETGNYVTIPHLGQAALFQHNIKPFWLDDYRNAITALGLAEEAGLWSRNSERLYWLSHKLNLEDLRKNPRLSGYTWWLLQDYWTGSNGLLDTYFRRKSIAPSEVLPFNSALVLLQDGLALTYEGGQPLEIKFLVSNFSMEAIERGTFRVRITSGSTLLRMQKFTAIKVPQGDLAEIASFRVELPEVPSPTTINVAVELHDTRNSCHNVWQARLFPRHMTPPSLPTSLYAADGWGPRLARLGLEALTLPSAPATNAVYVVTELTTKLLTAVESGASVLCLSPQGLFPATRNRFKPAWWLGNRESDMNAGTVVYDNPVTRGLAPEGWGDLAWYRLLEGATAYDLGEFSSADVLVRALDVHTFCRNKALLFQTRVGKGSLIVCGLKLDSNTPEARWLLGRLIAHAATFPEPKAAFPAAQLADLLGKSALPDGPFAAGFSRFVSRDLEQTRYPSYRATEEPIAVCRQTESGRVLEWETALLPIDWGGEAATFLFAGGLGWRSQPETAGFELQVNDTATLRFDLSRTSRTWTNPDTSLTLTFKPRFPMNEDAMGLFFLTIAPKHLAAGKPCRITVKSLGSGSRRWFGLNPLAEVNLE